MRFSEVWEEGRIRTVSLSQLIHLGTIILVKVRAQAVERLSQRILSRKMNALSIPARKATRAVPKTNFLVMVEVPKSHGQSTKAAQT